MKLLESLVNPNIVYVVSDAFKAFSQNPGVLTYSDFLRTAPALLNREEPTSVVVGQGIDKARRDTMLALLKKHGAGSDNLLCAIPDTDCVLQSLTHKHKQENVLLADLTRLDDTRFEASLAVDERCAEMSDHVTGQHIQGALLIEACRQMGLATLESLSLAEGRGHGAYSWGDFSVQYSRFLFPLPVKISATVTRREAKGETIRCELAIDFFQFDALAVECKVSAIQYPREFAEKMEARQAKRAASQFFAHASGVARQVAAAEPVAPAALLKA